MNEIQVLERPDGVLAIREPELPPPSRLLVLIHGWGGDEHSLWDYVASIPGDYRVLAPRGPVVKDPGEYGWRPTILGRRSHLSENTQPAADLLTRIDAWALAAGVDAGKFSIMGFSQGAALAYVLAGSFPERIARAVVLSGYPPRGLDLSEVLLQGIPFLVAHGTQDEIISLAEGRKALPMLQAAGAQVTYIEEQIRHAIGPQARAAIPAFLI